MVFFDIHRELKMKFLFGGRRSGCWCGLCICKKEEKNINWKNRRKNSS